MLVSVWSIDVAQNHKGHTTCRCKKGVLSVSWYRETPDSIIKKDVLEAYRTGNVVLLIVEQMAIYNQGTFRGEPTQYGVVYTQTFSKFRAEDRLVGMLSNVMVRKSGKKFVEEGVVRLAVIKGGAWWQWFNEMAWEMFGIEQKKGEKTYKSSRSWIAKLIKEKFEVKGFTGLSSDLNRDAIAILLSTLWAVEKEKAEILEALSAMCQEYGDIALEDVVQGLKQEWQQVKMKSLKFRS